MGFVRMQLQAEAPKRRSRSSRLRTTSSAAIFSETKSTVLPYGETVRHQIGNGL